ncbi:MAG: hypothetical protein RBS27_01730 [Giesbergeria sp.]|jgi:hypothetical protein|nr:hypothetical protein [Giesbergeria sp.]
MQDATAKTNAGTKHIVRYLSGRSDTVKIVNVEDDIAYRKKDIDLLWHRKIDGITKVCSIEVKVDTYFRTGNYFLETISNVEKNTPGCFLYSEADYFFYYFLEAELHVMHLEKIRNWFLPQLTLFARKRTSTPVADGFYQTEGRLVSRAKVQQELPGSVVVVKYHPDWAV